MRGRHRSKLSRWRVAARRREALTWAERFDLYRRGTRIAATLPLPPAIDRDTALFDLRDGSFLRATLPGELLGVYYAHPTNPQVAKQLRDALRRVSGTGDGPLS